MVVKGGSGTDHAVVSPSTHLVCSAIPIVVACFYEGSYFPLFLLGVMSSLPKRGVQTLVLNSLTTGMFNVHRHY